MKGDDLAAAARKLYDDAEGNPRRLAYFAAQFQAAARERGAGPLEVQGLVSTAGRPIVRLEWGPMLGQLSPDDARQHALLVLEAAGNAVTDAALLAWARDELELDLDRAAALIDGLRTYRADRWGQPDLELELERPPAPDPEEDPEP